MNRTRFRSLSSEFSLYMELESSEIHSSSSEISSLHSWSELFTRFFLESTVRIYTLFQVRFKVTLS